MPWTARRNHWVSVIEADRGMADMLAAVHDEAAVPMSEVGNAGRQQRPGRRQTSVVLLNRPQDRRRSAQPPGAGSVASYGIKN
jgi:hypothetical protein